MYRVQEVLFTFRLCMEVVKVIHVVFNVMTMHHAVLMISVKSSFMHSKGTYYYHYMTCLYFKCFQAKKAVLVGFCFNVYFSCQ